MNKPKTAYRLLRQSLALIWAVALAAALLPTPVFADTPEATESTVFTEPTAATESTQPTAATEPTAFTEPTVSTEPTQPTVCDIPDPITYTPQFLKKAGKDGLSLRITDSAGNDLSAADSLSYSHEDAGRTFFYLMEEALAREDGTVAAEAAYVLAVEISRQEDGTLIVSEKYYTPARELTWESLAALTPDSDALLPMEPVQFSLAARLELQGKPLQENEFRFVLDGHGDAAVDIGHDAAGNLNIPADALRFTAPGIYLLTLRQSFPLEDSCYRYDAAAFTAAVIVQPNAQGQHEAAFCDPPEEVVFVNSYSPAAEETTPETEATEPVVEETVPEIESTNPVVEETTPETQATEPEVEETTPETQATEPEAEETTPETQATEPEAVETTPETQATEPEAEETAPETQATEPEAEETVPETQAAPAPVTAVIRAKITLAGKELTAGAFTFALVDADNHTLTAVNDGAGEIAFSLSYSQPGTYVYTLREKLVIAPGMNSDKSIYRVTVTVTEGDDGLSAQVAYGTDDGTLPVFSNQYTPPPAQLTLTGTVKLTGRSMKASEFRFQVLDAAGIQVATGSNDAQGNILFTPIQLTDPGSYSFTVIQTDGHGWRMTYDASRFPVTVEVFQHDGVLYAGAVYPEGGICFANVYRPPVSDTPGTGDETPLSLLLTLMGLSGTGLALIGFAFLRRKNRQDDEKQ